MPEPTPDPWQLLSVYEDPADGCPMVQLEEVQAALATERQHHAEQIERMKAQAIEISVALSDAGVNSMPLPQAVRQVIEERNDTRAQLTSVEREFYRVLTEKAALTDRYETLKAAAEQALETCGIAKDFMSTSGTDPEAWLDGAIDTLRAALSSTPEPT